MKTKKLTTKLIFKQTIFWLFISLFSQQTCASFVDEEQLGLGVAALKSGDYDTALQWLVSAESMQSNHPDLKNALALAYYHLGNYAISEKYFQQALLTPRRYEATFFLGKLAEINNDYQKAEYWYQQAADQYEEFEIQAEADNALLNLSLRASGPNGKLEQGDQLRRFGFLSLDASKADGIVNPDDSSGENDSDISISILAAGSTTLSPKNSALDWKLGGSVYAEKYQDFSIYDVQSLGVNTSLSKRSGNHQWTGKLGYANFTLDGEPYLNQLDFSLKDIFPLSNTIKLVLQGRYIDVASTDETYQYYAGNLAELAAELRGGQDLKWRLGFAWRTEDRADLITSLVNANDQTLTGLTSYSRDWVRIRAKLSWSWSTRWQQKLEASLRSAKYHDGDLFLAEATDSSLTEQLRSATRVNLKAELTRKISDKIDLNFGWRLLDDESNNHRYDFNSQTIFTGMSYLF